MNQRWFVGPVSIAAER